MKLERWYWRLKGHQTQGGFSFQGDCGVLKLLSAEDKRLRTCGERRAESCHQVYSAEEESKVQYLPRKGSLLIHQGLK